MLPATIFVAIIFYLAALLGIAGRLRTKHAADWESLGRPSFENWSIPATFRLGYFVLLSGQHSRLGDRVLTVAVYVTRALLVAIIIGLVIENRLLVR